MAYGLKACSCHPLIDHGYEATDILLYASMWISGKQPIFSCVHPCEYRGYKTLKDRAVASLAVPGGQEFHFPHFPPIFDNFYLIFPQTFLIFFLILTLRVGEALATPLPFDVALI